MATDHQAWFMDDVHENSKLPHHCNPPQFVSSDYLSELGVLQWKLNPGKYEDDEELESIRTARGYNYMINNMRAKNAAKLMLHEVNRNRKMMSDYALKFAAENPDDE